MNISAESQTVSEEHVVPIFWAEKSQARRNCESGHKLVADSCLFVEEIYPFLQQKLHVNASLYLNSL
jgi:hypothetical protein